MLFLHTSNQLEQLSNQFSVTINSPLKEVFTAETVIVQNAGMARHLSMRLADVAGISANMEYLFPAEFMWKLLRLVSPKKIPEQNQCSPETLRFHIMSELSHNFSDYPELHHYILNADSIDENACWNLSCELSQLLDQYLFYRSDWIRQWEATDDSENWQSRLWQRCVKNKQLIHWLDLQDQFKYSLQAIDSSSLPERVTFFSMSALSPGYLDLLGELAKKTDVHLYIMNPCKDAYWGDISSEKSRSKLPLEEQSYAEVGNPLLASMGNLGRDFIHQLLDLPEPVLLSTDEKNTNSTATSVLQHVQNDIFHLNQPTKITDYKPREDISIKFNACHTAMREVEVLHDQILDALEAEPSLSPADIVVMMPNIESYAPYIEAVFSSNQFSATQQKLPFSIADRDPLVVHTIIEALLKVLMLADTRFDVESVFELLDYDIIHKQFNLDETQVLKCRNLARATNIRWGISAQTRAQNNLPETEEHTWKYALDRLLLGYTIGTTTSGEQLFNSDRLLSLLPFSDIEGSDAIMLANFKRFTDTLFSINTWHKTQQPLKDWLAKTKSLLQQLFADNNADTTKILLCIDDLEGSAQLADFKQDIPFGVYQKIVQGSLKSISASENFLGHGITFCALVPMRSVPFKVVALMGMNDGEFPRQDKHHSFDLMANKPRRGDRSRRNEDRYLFLESILAARARLIISYTGQSVKDNTELPPSVLVSELLESLVTYTDVPVEDWIFKHPLQAFSPHYFDSTDRLYSYAKEYTSLHKSAVTPSQTFITEKLSELDESYKNISLDDLISFYQSPARTFLKTRFAIQTFDEDITLPVREPFELEFFKQREIRSLVMEDCEDSSLQIARAKGFLPYGDIGDEVYNNEKQIIENFKEQLPEIDYQESQRFSLELNDYHLHGEMNRLSASGRMIQNVTQPYFRDYLDLWINHLVLNSQAVSGITKQSTFYSPELSFILKPVSNAQQQLQKLVEYYWQGLHFPLYFFPKTAFATYKDKGFENLKNATTTWQGDTQRAGEKDKFENWLLYRTMNMNENIPEEFLDISQLVFGEMYLHLEGL